MASKIDTLIGNFEKVVNTPWASSLSGMEKIWFLVYDPADQRKIDFRLSDFEIATIKAGKKWKMISMKSCFPNWMYNHDYREEYFKSPLDIADSLQSSFVPYATEFLKKRLAEIDHDKETLIAIRDVSSLFGFMRISELLNNCANDFKGHLLIFFPGEFENSQYRLLNARDGWNYLARPITI